MPNPVFEIPNCPVKGVVVYQDRAEVCRVVKPTLTTGENEVVIRQISQLADKDSFRVEGKGSASITEVTYRERQITDTDAEATSTEKIAELKTEVSNLDKQLVTLKAKEERLTKQKTGWDGMLESVSSAGSKEGQKWIGDDEWLTGVGNFMNTYNEKRERLENQIQGTTLAIREAEEKLKAARANLNKASRVTTRYAREVSILLDATEDGEVVFHFSYVIANAEWTPQYDVRVFSDDYSLKLLYFGMIKQNTEEDWVNASLCLSTAVPSIGGSVPPLETHELSFLKPAPMCKHKALKQKNGKFRMMKKTSFQEEQAEKLWCGAAPMNEELIPAALPISMRMPVTDIKEGVTSTTFEIARPTTIPCDGTAHKVSIAIIDLQPKFEYQCIPKKSAHAYFKACVTNTSPYALLAGPCNVFLDNNFISKSELNSVSPSEEFTCSLGVDPAIRVIYPPQHKYHEKSGLWSKVSTLTYKQEISIKNTRAKPIKITVEEQYPRSTEDKIKVTMVEPVIPKDKHETAVRINHRHNVEWVHTIKNGESETFVLKYTVEHPAEMALESAFVLSDQPFL